MEAGLINEVVNRGGGFPCYQSAVPPEKLVPAAAMAALEYSGTTALPDESPESLAGSAATVAGIEAVPATRREKA